MIKCKQLLKVKYLHVRRNICLISIIMEFLIKPQLTSSYTYLYGGKWKDQLILCIHRHVTNRSVTSAPTLKNNLAWFCKVEDVDVLHSNNFSSRKIPWHPPALCSRRHIQSIYRLVDNTKTLETTQTICQPETGKIYIVIQNNSENKWTSPIIHNRSTGHSLQT